jgi:dTDP-4-amino-4,6-dideoxygalactose transaminase
VAKVIRSRKLMRDFGGQGTWCERFEAALAQKLGVRYALTTCSGTTALIAALVGLGIGPGDEVIVPAYTFMATALAPLAVGAIPIIAEVNETLMIDPADVERKVTRYTRAIIPVDMIGRACDMSAILRIARRHKLYVVEDACQAVGGSYRGRRLGAIGHAGAYSFNYYKNISCGEGGCVFTDSRSIFERALIYQDGALRLYTRAKKPREAVFAGVKLRFTEVQAAIMSEQLKRLDKILNRLRARQAAMREVLERSAAFRVCPSNDLAGDCGSSLPILFEKPREALAFMRTHAKRVGMMRPYDTGKHVYSRWDPVLQKRGSHHPLLNPYRYAKRKIPYSKDMCKRSLDIMARTIALSVPYQATVAEARALARRLL